MPNEPCANMERISRDELEALRKAAGERDEAVAAVAGIRVKAKEHLCDQCLGSEIKPCEVGRDWNEPICGQACNMREFFDWLESTSSLGADILQRMREQDVALATMREALEYDGTGHNMGSAVLAALRLAASQIKGTDGYDPKKEFEHAAWLVQKALSIGSGKATLERIRDLEAKAARLDYLRPEVLWFAEQMERQLRLHDTEAEGTGSV